VGRELGVRSVEGSIRASDKRARVSTQLVEAENAKQIRTQRFEVELADTFDLQDEIAHLITRERITSGPAAKVAAFKGRYMAAPERFAETSDSSCTAGAVHTWHF
jgi:hypothetical protein